MRRSIGSSGSTGSGGAGSLNELLELLELTLSVVEDIEVSDELSCVETLELLLDELPELTISDVETAELLLTGELLSGAALEELLLELLPSELEALELCSKLLTAEELAVPELCGAEDPLSLKSTLITVAPDVSVVVLQPVRFAHITKSDNAAAKNLDFLFIAHHSITV